MKKIVYTLGLALLAASCSEDYMDWSVSQTNPQEDAKSVSLETATAADVDYAALDSSLVQIFKPTITAVDECSTTYQVTLWNEGKSANGTLAANDSGYVVADELKTVVETLYGKRPVARKLLLDIAGYSNINGQSIRTTAKDSVNVTLVAPYISTSYYIVGAPSQWDVMCVDLPFTHSGKDVYEDPVFTVTFPVADGEYWFAIADDKTHEANDWSALLGCAEGNGNNGMEGQIARRPEIGDDGSWKVVVAGDARFVRMTINMMDYTYKIEKLNFGEFIYEIGNESGWSTSHALRSPNFDGKYQGYYWMDGEYKFKPNADNWDGDWENDGEGKIADNGGANMPGLAAGFYQIDVNLADMTYAATLVESISIIGSANGNWDTDTDLTYNQATGAWEVTTTLNAGEMKFRMNHDWAISWGGANGDGTNYGDLTQNNGANLQVAAGTYLVQLYIQHEGANKVVLTAQ
ncbi:MAG: DUF5115 domain-containing protein [Bacteroidaceae bacterium]|nr:DUF5115 domain-containing protein [Bacteroidaceae bacterium]